MGISTQTEDIIKFYNQSISLDLNQITQINSVEVGFAVTTGIGSTQQIRVWGPQEIIDNYNVPIQKLEVGCTSQTVSMIYSNHRTGFLMKMASGIAMM